MKSILSRLCYVVQALVLGLCLVFAQAASAIVVRVDRESTATMPTGESWPLAFNDLEIALQFARDLAESENPVTEIWVANGTYTPTDEQTSDPRSATFFIGGDLNGIKIYGGFQGLSLDNGDGKFERAF